MAAKLSETVRAIRKAKGLTQRAWAEEMGVDFQDIQRAENAGRNLEKQFRLFRKILQSAQGLKDPSLQEVLSSDENTPTPKPDGEKASSNDTPKQVRSKATTISPLSPRKLKSHSGR